MTIRDIHDYRLPPALAARLEAFALSTGEDATDILADALTFHLDDLDEEDARANFLLSPSVSGWELPS